MKVVVVVVCFVIVGFVSTKGQQASNSIEKIKPNYDSLWYFHPFSIDLAAGVWTPIGKLAAYYSPSFQFGASVGFMTSPKTRMQLWIVPRCLNSKTELPLVMSDTNAYSNSGSLGAALGGFFSRRVFLSKSLCSEITAGITWEEFPVDIKSAVQEDASIGISGIGLSVGFSTWFNAWAMSNFGVRCIYTYATFDNSTYITKSIGNQLISFSIVYRMGRRNYEWKKWY